MLLMVMPVMIVLKRFGYDVIDGGSGTDTVKFLGIMLIIRNLFITSKLINILKAGDTKIVSNVENFILMIPLIHFHKLII